ncbi:MAG TPA: dihydropteroate synthase [Chitinophagaceae bacterium]|nr:dihydropteroate synthase [Chitinophagaceae bacterium]
MYTLNCMGRMVATDKPLVMGILNITPDSFYAPSRTLRIDDLLERAGIMLSEGADILDIGGQSSRPGAGAVDADKEWERVAPALEALRDRFPNAILSIDTFHASVARKAVKLGVSMVNDISAGNLDPVMLETVAELEVPYVLMHMRGNPSTMHHESNYEDVTREVLDFLIRKLHEVRSHGIRDVIVDPGFGFAKTISQNFELLRNLESFRMLDCPILVGLSRKSTIYKTLGIDAEDSLNGTTVVHTIALLNGANMLRVHDVKAAVEAITLFLHYKK